MINNVCVVPDPQEPKFALFCEFIRSAEVRPARGLSRAEYQNHFEVLEVPVYPQIGASLGYCWFNCLEYQLANGGEVLYGWALWRTGDIYQAQHHAIWIDKQGMLLDPTPNKLAANHILFMPDNRAPFDIHSLRSPFSVEWSGDRNWSWRASNGMKLGYFAVAVLDPTPAESERINNIRQKMASLSQV